MTWSYFGPPDEEIIVFAEEVHALYSQNMAFFHDALQQFVVEVTADWTEKETARKAAKRKWEKAYKAIKDERKKVDAGQAEPRLTNREHGPATGWVFDFAINGWVPPEAARTWPPDWLQPDPSVAIMVGRLAILHDVCLPKSVQIVKQETGIDFNATICDAHARPLHGEWLSCMRSASLGPGFQKEIHGSRRILRTYLDSVRGAATETAITAMPAERSSSRPATPRLDKQKLRISVNGTWHNVTETQTRMLAVLFEADGAWVGGKTIGGRPDKTRKAMPKPVAAAIETHRAYGYRIPSLLS